MLQTTFAADAMTITRHPRVLMVSTEYRLYRVGGLGAHVRALVPRLADSPISAISAQIRSLRPGDGTCR